jgi:WASH complex subunit CCDC53
LRWTLKATFVIYQVPPLEPKRTLYMLNTFVIHTVDFLNKFATAAEDKLQDLSFRVQQLEVTLNILDEQLKSIGDLESIQATTTYNPPPELQAAGSNTAASSTGQTKQTQKATVTESTSGEGDIPPPPPADGPPPLPGDDENEGPPLPPPEESSVLKVKDDPRYKEFFRKMRIGANPLQLAMEMRNKGLNPDLLETPDAPAPQGGGGAVAPPLPHLLRSFSSSTESSNSDSDDEFSSSASGFSSDSD